MNVYFWKSLCYRAILIFVLAFIFILPFDYYLLPLIGQALAPIILEMSTILIEPSEGGFHSDSSIMLAITIALSLLSLMSAFIWMMLKKAGANHLTIQYWLQRISAYYLSLALFIYGFNKLFKFQFYFPEPNTLFTPLGQLSPDILYWSSIGTSYSYSVFAGLIEVIPALLLLFRKTRMLGAAIALFVLINVMMINVGFGIEVKIYTAFLLLLCLVLLAPHFTRLFHFFILNSTVKNFNESGAPTSKSFQKITPFIKIMLIGVILTESLVPYLETMQFNGDKNPKVYMHGAYELHSNDQNMKRIFFHNKGYFILQDKDDRFIDYKMNWHQDILFLTDYEGQKSNLSLIKNTDGSFRFSGILFNKIVNWNFTRIDLEALAVNS